MKHSLPITVILISLFFISQLAGLFLVTYDATQTVTVDEQNVSTVNVTYSDTAMGQRPEFQRQTGPLWYLVIGIAIATGVLLVLMRLKTGRYIWKAWYALAVVIAISITLGVFLESWIALSLAIVLAYLKMRHTSPLTHNLTEILTYAGIAFLLIPLFKTVWVSVALLLLISLYDMYAVWKSKHMVRLAKFTTDSNVFAGLALPYSNKGVQQKATTSKQAPKQQARSQDHSTSSPKKKRKQAILGGGDIVFPLLFAGTVLTSLLETGFSKYAAFSLVSIIPVITTIALTLLFFKGKKDRFYPAMPYLTAGCLVGYGLLQLLLLTL